MLKKIVLENFRGFNVEYVFGRTNKILGRNGAGKSSIKEALSFLFTGCDSAGRRAPTHLISWGEDSCRVEVHTEKAVVTRTLSQSKKTGLRIDQAGRGVPMNQSDLENRLMASSELFMSVLLPGYFMGLSETKQLAVLSEILPPIDRHALLSEIVGHALSDEEVSRYDLSGRPDQVAARIAADRRELQRTIDFKAGHIGALSSRTCEREEPVRPVEADLLPRLEQTRQSWINYRARFETYRGAQKLYESTAHLNEQIRARRAELETELSQFKYVDEPPPPKFAQQVAALREKLLPLPPQPPLNIIVEDDRCSSCGQVVGVKHRDQTRRQNAKILEAHSAKLEEVVRVNNLVEEEITAAKASYEMALERSGQVREHNNRVRQLEARLKGELSGLQERPLPSIPLKPEEPLEAYDELEAQRMGLVVEDYTRRKNEYDYLQKEAVKSAEEAKALKAECELLARKAEHYKKLEQGLAALPQEELRRQSEALVMPRYKIVVGDGVEIYDEAGRPYPSLSTGEQMKASIHLALKFDSMAKRKVGMMFVDNADLIDEPPTDLSAQLFLAIVDKKKDAVEIKSSGTTTSDL